MEEEEKSFPKTTPEFIEKTTEVAPGPEVMVPIPQFNVEKNSDPLLSSKKSPIFNVDANAFKGFQSNHNRAVLFDAPFAYILLNPLVLKYCSNCLHPPTEDQILQLCGACKFSKYCNRNCQKQAWKVHRSECRRLRNAFPNLPLTEVLFLSRCVDKVIFLEIYGDKFGWEKVRKFSELMDHKDDIRADSFRMKQFDKIYSKILIFRKEEMLDKEKFFDIYCKVTINSHSVHNNGGDEIGMSMDLGVSLYNHSCRPNCTMVFDGYKIFMRSLSKEINPYDINRSFISYIDVGRSKYRRRKELKEKWCFVCQCDRCQDPEDDILTSIRCPNKACDEPLITSEDAKPIMITCPKCKTVASKEYVMVAQELMITLPILIEPSNSLGVFKEYLKRAEAILHPHNVYVNRLKTAICYITGKFEEAVDIQKFIYENYKRCYPPMDRHNGFNLVKIVQTLIKAGNRKDAVSYAYDAMTIFEVCFGMNHPYYLQTLALWTFLSKNVRKTDAELLGLTNFSNTRPVNITSYLSLASVTDNYD